MIQHKEIYRLLLMISLLFTSCNNPSVEDDPELDNVKEEQMKEPYFELFDIDFNASIAPNILSQEGNYSSWLLENRSGKISIETIQNKGESISNESISIYDNYLSTSISERDQYTILDKSINGIPFRLIERSHSKDTNFIELYANNLCSDHSQLLITGVDVSKKDREWLKECFQSIRIKCDD